MSVTLETFYVSSLIEVRDNGRQDLFLCLSWPQLQGFISKCWDKRLGWITL